MDQIGEYLIRRLVGEGGMGKVYEAEERLSKRRVALKVIREELSQSERARALFLNEMQILAQLEHPNIVRSLASFEWEGQLAIALEYLDGQTLRSVITRRGKLPWTEATHIVLSAARALVEAHGRRPPIIHRDLKPENIMVLDDDSVRVMDFGIAKLIQQLDQTNTQSVGTLQYMSPEQIDAHSIDPRADLYCLGLVFYELLTGHPPFQSTSTRMLLNLQCTESPPELSEDVRDGLASGLEALLFQLLEKKPADRPGSADELVDSLAMFLPRSALNGEGRRSSHSLPRAVAKTQPSTTDGADSDPAAPAGGTVPGAPAALERSTAKGASGAAGGTVLVDEAPEGTLPAGPLAPRWSGDGAEGGLWDRLRHRLPAELSTAASVAIIVLLALAAGVATYVLRTCGGSASEETVEPTDSAPYTDGPDGP